MIVLPDAWAIILCHFADERSFISTSVETKASVVTSAVKIF